MALEGEEPMPRVTLALVMERVRGSGEDSLLHDIVRACFVIVVEGVSCLDTLSTFTCIAIRA